MVYAMTKKRIANLEKQLAMCQREIIDLKTRLLDLESKKQEENIEDSGSLLSSWAKSQR